MNVLQQIRASQLQRSIQLFEVCIDLGIQQIVCRHKARELRRTFKNKALNPFVIDTKPPR